MSDKGLYLTYKVVFDKMLADPQSELELAVYKISWTDDLGHVCYGGDWIGTIEDAHRFCESKRQALYQKYYRYIEGIRGELPGV